MVLLDSKLSILISFNDRQLLNIYDKFFTLVLLKFDKSNDNKELQLSNI